MDLVRGQDRRPAAGLPADRRPVPDPLAGHGRAHRHPPGRTASWARRHCHRAHAGRRIHRRLPRRDHPGIVFQYFAIAPMRGLSLRKGLTEAAKADVASLTAFEVGLFGWMALMTFVFFPAPHHLHPDSPVYW